MLIFTIGIGSPKGEVLPVKGEHGQLDYVRDENGNAVNNASLVFDQTLPAAPIAVRRVSP